MRTLPKEIRQKANVTVHALGIEIESKLRSDLIAELTDLALSGASNPILEQAIREFETVHRRRKPERLAMS